MKKFVEKTLMSERTRTANSTDIKRPIDINLNDPTLKAQTGHVTLTEDEEINKEEENDENKLILNALIIIFDSEMRGLILKRSSFPDQWMPNKLCLVGGGVEEGEEPIVAAKREALEETGIKLENLKEIFVIQRDERNVEHLFISKLPDRYDTYNVKLDKENDGYMWLSSDELSKINKNMAVPNLLDYVRIAATKYDD
jgi:8-oxo-dGTP pyrophosphatase MutT (NUDIX family)